MTPTISRRPKDQAPRAWDIARWHAVEQRDSARDGQFFYAVKTTGVFCRPSCPARRPLPGNVEFFDSADAAAAAGYRACLRCRPLAGGTADPHRRKILDACRRIETALEPPSLAELAAAAGLSPFHFQKLFKAAIGLTPKQYAKAHRERRVRDELPVSRTITEAIYDAGFQSSARFYADAARMIGMQPARRRAGGRGETIRFAIGECSLGVLLVAATDKGLCTVALGDDPKPMLETFLSDFADAEIVGGDAGFETLVANVVGLIEHPERHRDLPLDVRGTAFQKMVWNALTTIRRGETATYAEVARLIGQPEAARAVARACGANRIAVAIPCHRVIRGDGALSGYRWGVERKRALLDREKAA